MGEIAGGRRIVPKAEEVSHFLLARIVGNVLDLIPIPC